jgi:putative transposase
MAVGEMGTDLSQAFEDGQHLAQEVNDWFRWYNQHRPHQSLNYQTPDEVYYVTTM